MSELRKWEKSKGESFTNSLREAVLPQLPLRPRLEKTRKAIDIPIIKLEKRLSKLRTQESELFNKVANDLKHHEGDLAIADTYELDEVRKTIVKVMSLKIILEKVNVKLSNITQFSDIVSSLVPIMPVVKSVKKRLAETIPETGSELTEATTMLGNLLTEAGSLSGNTIRFEPNSDEAEKIMDEAKSIAESKMNLSFPLLSQVEQEEEKS
tara:strand:+ start:157 stop:786 length:630 start_codon:yes stop_codon:yes gene_type:complete